MPSSSAFVAATPQSAPPCNARSIARRSSGEYPDLHRKAPTWSTAQVIDERAAVQRALDCGKRDLRHACFQAHLSHSMTVVCDAVSCRLTAGIGKLALLRTKKESAPVDGEAASEVRRRLLQHLARVRCHQLADLHGRTYQRLVYKQSLA
jgi:hypothetical protein